MKSYIKLEEFNVEWNNNLIYKLLSDNNMYFSLTDLSLHEIFYNLFIALNRSI
jgi:hypothetical protein